VRTASKDVKRGGDWCGTSDAERECGDELCCDRVPRPRAHRVYSFRTFVCSHCLATRNDVNVDGSVTVSEFERSRGGRRRARELSTACDGPGRESPSQDLLEPRSAARRSSSACSTDEGLTRDPSNWSELLNVARRSGPSSEWQREAGSTGAQEGAEAERGCGGARRPERTRTLRRS
jgi:hypothetical protein